MRAVTALVRSYWASDERWFARGLLAVIVAMNLALVYVNVLFSAWNNRFYDALQQHDVHLFSRELAVFCGLALVYIVLAVYQTYLGQMLQIRWRRWLTDHYLGQWLGDRAYFQLEVAGQRPDNADQRIANDLQLFVDGTLTLGLGLLSSIVTLASFATILWGLSGTLDVSIGRSHIAIPGYMLWAALLYSLLGTWLTHRIGAPLVRLNFDQQRFEADFRFALVRLRENAEPIALYRGEEAETAALRGRFGQIAANWWAIMKRQKRLTWFTSGYNQVAVVFPVLAAAPRYFSGAMQLGGLMQTAQAFGQVQGALSWFVGAYAALAQWKATVDRLNGFTAAIVDARAHAADAGLRRVPHAARSIDLRHVAVALPDGTPLVADLDVSVRAGESWLIKGASGTGKSTLVRAIAGIWPFGFGVIEVPARARMLFLPQRAYLPVGTLRDALCYPSAHAAFTDDALREVLAACEVSYLADRLDESANWAMVLSPGEQQRLAFARALLQRPDWLFLDEATSALDEASEAMLYRLLRERLRRATIVSVGHRSTLAAFHDHQLDIGRGIRSSTPEAA
ncbi:MAG TPA: ABC transporter ATP-binding protein/permease [Burkholderiaceae bacterium]|nr:ABC transporter ATP-binding protein/permease [Burkholderiaceae bacterium]